MTDQSEPRVAVYIDFDNIVISRYDQIHGKTRFMVDKARGFEVPRGKTNGDVARRISEATVDIGAVLDFATSFGTVVISRAYADWSAPVNAGYQKQLITRAVDLTQLFPTAQYTKNGADIRLAVDAVEDMFRLPDITHVVIVAGDSDYIALAQRCKRLGRYVVGIGVAGSTSRYLAAACDEFADYDDLPGVKADALEPGEPLPEAPAPSTEILPESEPVDAAAPVEPAPKVRRRASVPAGGPSLEPSAADPAETATELLVRAMRLVHAKSDDEWAHSGGVKSQMQRMDPSFNEKSLGFKSFSDFVKSHESVVQIGTGAPAGRLKLRTPGTRQK